MNEPSKTIKYLELTTEIVSAYVANNPVQSDKLAELLTSVQSTLQKLPNSEIVHEATKQKPAVSIKKSLQPDHIVCLECGLTFKSIKRHLNSSHKLNPDEYRQKWRLLSDYPMVTELYSTQRSKLARDFGLGRKRKR